ncbi:proteasome subunit beta type-7-like [Amblyraja radiata]|uniref:proteasome subunit beta type-7-like n=1 Tax=Amblyraja radiata TaxID=386614 RepID=UPI001403C760|nr:proteasome subunit beta type-7-like [Amblyraja radiata]
MKKGSKLLSTPAGGFSFENCGRNTALEEDLQQGGLKAPKPNKTGTTIAGVIFKDGVILGSDTRATNDMVVADKNCIKIHHIAPNIYCCGAGVAADAEVTMQLIASNIQLHSLSTGRQARVATVNRMLKQMLFRYQGRIGVSVIIGGVDCTGPHLYSVHPHGFAEALPFAADGSGAAAAIATLEDQFKPNMEEEAAKQMVKDAIMAGIFCDLGSGSNVDLCVITKNKVTFLRGFDCPNAKGEKKGMYRYKQGTTAVLSESVTPLQLELMEEVVQRMDTE